MVETEKIRSFSTDDILQTVIRGFIRSTSSWLNCHSTNRGNSCPTVHVNQTCVSVIRVRPIDGGATHQSNTYTTQHTTQLHCVNCTSHTMDKLHMREYNCVTTHTPAVLILEDPSRGEPHTRQYYCVNCIINYTQENTFNWDHFIRVICGHLTMVIIPRVYAAYKTSVLFHRLTGRETNSLQIYFNMLINIPITL